MESTTHFLREKFGKKDEILNSNLKALQAGYNYGDTTETFTTTYKVEKARMESGTYRSIMGNQALAYGLIAASQKSGLPLFLVHTRSLLASDILHELARHKNFGVKTFQAEDEIAGHHICYRCCLWWPIRCNYDFGARPGIKGRSNGACSNARDPLIICDIQRGGPSTGLPTKTEQSDLLQAYYGRNGECPMPSDLCVNACRLFRCYLRSSKSFCATHDTVIFLSDGYIANGAEPWKFPTSDQLPPIHVNFKTELGHGEEKLQPYLA
jgi:2-oxoglutarate ferredoxin oxidoreductase subunit alpha